MKRRWSRIAAAIGITAMLAVFLLLTVADTKALPQSGTFHAVRLPSHPHAWFECCQDEVDTYNMWVTICRILADDDPAKPFACLMVDVSLAVLMYCETCHPWPLCGSWGWCGEG